MNDFELELAEKIMAANKELHRQYRKMVWVNRVLFFALGVAIAWR